MMDYLLNRYLYAFLPFTVSDDWKKSVNLFGMSVVRVADWFCKTRDLWHFYLNHSDFLFAEIVYPVLALVVFVHAYRHGGRYVYTWLGIYFCQLIAGIATSLSDDPIINNSWFAQGILTFFGARIPLSSVFGANQVFLYIAYVFVQRMYLPTWAQATATGIGFFLLKLPYLVIGTKYLWWTWHNIDNTDPIFGIPWIVYFYEPFFAISFVHLLQIARLFFLHEIYDWKKFPREFFCIASASVLAFLLRVGITSVLLSVSQQCQIPIGTLVCSLLTLFAIVVYIADRHNPTFAAASRGKNSFWFDELSLAVCVHFIFLVALSLVVNPANIISEGLHQPLGPCKTGEQHLCEIRSSYYDFHCLPGGKLGNYEHGLEWYAICGTPISNRTDFSFTLSAYCFLALLLLYQAAAASGQTPRVYRLVYCRSADRKKTK